MCARKLSYFAKMLKQRFGTITSSFSVNIFPMLLSLFFLIHSFILSFIHFWDMNWVCNPGWPQTQNPPVSHSLMLRFQNSATMMDLH
jgi:hypothetical protein